MPTFARHSSYKAGTTSSHEGKALRVKQNVKVSVISCNILAVLPNGSDSVSLSDEALCVLGVLATVQLYFTAEERLAILIRRPSTLSRKAI